MKKFKLAVVLSVLAACAARNPPDAQRVVTIEPTTATSLSRVVDVVPANRANPAKDECEKTFKHAYARARFGSPRDWTPENWEALYALANKTKDRHSAWGSVVYELERWTAHLVDILKKREGLAAGATAWVQSGAVATLGKVMTLEEMTIRLQQSPQRLEQLFEKIVKECSQQPSTALCAQTSTLRTLLISVLADAPGHLQASKLLALSRAAEALTANVSAVEGAAGERGVLGLAGDAAFNLRKREKARARKDIEAAEKLTSKAIAAAERAEIAIARYVRICRTGVRD